jgi:hypothetical protein
MKSSLAFFLLLLVSSFVLSDDEVYVQLIDKYSFNLKDRSQIDKLLKNYFREGETIYYEDYIMLTPRKNNTFGLIHTRGEIFSEKLELQMKFRINSVKNKGSAFAIWFIKDDLDTHISKDRSLVGYKTTYEGHAVFLLTPPKQSIQAKTFIFTNPNNGTSVLNPGFKKISYMNSCNDNFHERIVKLTIKLDTQENNMSIKYDTKDQLTYPCFDYINLEGLKPPYRIGISSFNGIIEGDQYLDNIQIEKLSLFNFDEKLKDKYITNGSQISNKLNLTESFIDLISTYEYNFENSKESSVNINDAINLLSSIDKNFKTNFDKHIDSLDKLKSFIEDFKFSVKDLNEKLSNNLIHTNKSQKESDEGERSIDYDYLKKSLEELKFEWHNKEFKDKITAGLNQMLSDKIDQIFKTLNSTEDSHSKYSEKLVNLINLEQ